MRTVTKPQPVKADAKAQLAAASPVAAKATEPAAPAKKDTAPTTPRVAESATATKKGHATRAATGTDDGKKEKREKVVRDSSKSATALLAARKGTPRRCLTWLTVTTGVPMRAVTSLRLAESARRSATRRFQSSRRATSGAASTIDSSQAIITVCLKNSIQPSHRDRNCTTSGAWKCATPSSRVPEDRCRGLQSGGTCSRVSQKLQSIT